MEIIREKNHNLNNGEISFFFIIHSLSSHSMQKSAKSSPPKKYIKLYIFFFILQNTEKKNKLKFIFYTIFNFTIIDFLFQLNDFFLLFIQTNCHNVNLSQRLWCALNLKKKQKKIHKKILPHWYVNHIFNFKYSHREKKREAFISWFFNISFIQSKGEDNE